jgi:hypothetical protein
MLTLLRSGLLTGVSAIKLALTAETLKKSPSQQLPKTFEHILHIASLSGLDDNNYIDSSKIRT